MKLLITGGCSFSECVSRHIDTWPRHLAKELSDYTHISTGLGSQGNGLISRKIIYQTQKNLGNEIVVGVVWSGPDRHDFYLNPIENLNVSRSMENPTTVIDNSVGGWIITNPYWKDSYSKLYYSKFHSSIGQIVYTYEHILRTQWFLEKLNIKYFMGTYTGEVFSANYLSHPEVNHLYNQFDRSTFLPVDGIYEWCRDFSNLEFPVKGDNHPSSDQHKLFTEQVIVPFLKEKNYI